jgi:hypothetical protein
MKKILLFILLLSLTIPVFILFSSIYENDSLILNSHIIRIDAHYFSVIYVLKHFLLFYLFIVLYLIYLIIIKKK